MRNPRQFWFVFFFLCFCLGFSTAAGAQTSHRSGSSQAAAKAYQEGLAHLQRNEPQQALESLERAAKLDPNNPEIQNAVAQLLLQKKDFDGAIAHFRTVVRLRPKLAVAHAYLGQAQSQTILFANMVNQQAQYASIAATSLTQELTQLFSLGDQQ